MTIASNNKRLKYLELIYCSWEGENVTAILEKSLTFSYKVKHILTIWSRNSTSEDLVWEMQNYIQTKKFCNQIFIVALLSPQN